MNLLLDTHIFLWSLLEPKKLTARVAKELESPGNDLWLSPITTWETLVLMEKGRVVVDSDPVAWFKEVFRTISFKEALLNHAVAIRSRRLTLTHEDPADRFLAATAIVYDLTLVTADHRLLGSKEFRVLANT